MEMKPYGRKARNHSRAAAQYSHPQEPAYYLTAMDFGAAATCASVIYPAPYAPPTAAYYNPPPPAHPAYFGFQPTDKRTVEGMVRNQIEYYFSENNLIKDVYIRSKMDKDGFVLLSEICSFQRVRSLTQDMDTVLSALSESETIEICDGIKIRPKKDPLRWPYPVQLQYVSAAQPGASPQQLAPQQQHQQSHPQQQAPLVQQRQPQQAHNELNATRSPTQPLSQQQQQPQSTSCNRCCASVAVTTPAIANNSIQLHDQHESEIQLASHQHQQPIQQPHLHQQHPHQHHHQHHNHQHHSHHNHQQQPIHLSQQPQQSHHQQQPHLNHNHSNHNHNHNHNHHQHNHNHNNHNHHYQNQHQQPQRPSHKQPWQTQSSSTLPSNSIHNNNYNNHNNNNNINTTSSRNVNSKTTQNHSKDAVSSDETSLLSGAKSSISEKPNNVGLDKTQSLTNQPNNKVAGVTTAAGAKHNTAATYSDGANANNHKQRPQASKTTGEDQSISLEESEQVNVADSPAPAKHEKQQQQQQRQQQDNHSQAAATTSEAKTCDQATLPAPADDVINQATQKSQKSKPNRSSSGNLLLTNGSPTRARESARNSWMPKQNNSKSSRREAADDPDQVDGGAREPTFDSTRISAADELVINRKLTGANKLLSSGAMRTSFSENNIQSLELTAGSSIKSANMHKIDSTLQNSASGSSQSETSSSKGGNDSERPTKSQQPKTKRRGSSARNDSHHHQVRLSSLPQVKLLNLNCTSATSSSVNLRWSYVPQLAEKYGIHPHLLKSHPQLIDHFVVESSYAKNATDQNCLVAPKIVYQGCAMSCRVNHLSSDRIYHFKVRRTTLATGSQVAVNKSDESAALGCVTNSSSNTREHLVVSDVLSVTLPSAQQQSTSSLNQQQQQTSSKRSSGNSINSNNNKSGSNHQQAAALLSNDSNRIESTSNQPARGHHHSSSHSSNNKATSHHHNHNSNHHHHHHHNHHQPIKVSQLLKQCRTSFFSMLGKFMQYSLSSCSDTKFAGLLLVLFTILAMLLALFIHVYIVVPINSSSVGGDSNTDNITE